MEGEARVGLRAAVIVELGARVVTALEEITVAAVVTVAAGVTLVRVVVPALKVEMKGATRVGLR